MTPELSIATLRATGLSVDWMTVYVGWNPPDWSSYTPFSVTIDEVQEVAVGALANCAPQDEDGLFRIADDATHWHGDVDRLLPEFAQKSGVSETDALRKWRVVFLTGLLETLAHWINGPRSPGGDYLPNVMDIGGENIYDIECYLRQWDISFAPIPPVLGETRTEMLENLARLPEWLAQEKAELVGK